MGFFAAITMYGIILALNYHCSCVNFFHPVNNNTTMQSSDSKNIH